MIVADLKQHLSDLAKLLESAGGGKPFAKDLALAAEGLTPFADKPIGEFARLLALAHEYHTTGKLTAPPKATRAKTPKAAKVKVDPAEIATTIRQLYDRSGDLSLTTEHIEAELAKLVGMTKPGLLVVCERMELAGMKNKKVDDIREAIKLKILDRRSSAQREQMIESPPAGDPIDPGDAGV